MAVNRRGNSKLNSSKQHVIAQIVSNLLCKLVLTRDPVRVVLQHAKGEYKLFLEIYVGICTTLMNVGRTARIIFDHITKSHRRGFPLYHSNPNHFRYTSRFFLDFLGLIIDQIGTMDRQCHQIKLGIEPYCYINHPNIKLFQVSQCLRFERLSLKILLL